MNPKQINKLYSQLNPSEQANLAFEAAMRKDEKDVDLIMSRVEQKTYITGHADYHARSYGLIQLSGVFGIAYWKAFFILSTNDFTKTGSPVDKEAQIQINKFIAVNAALINVCKILKVDVEAIREYAECKGIEPKFKGIPDKVFLEKYTELFMLSAGLVAS